MTKNRFPAGWDAERVNNLLRHYEEQSEDEAVAEAEEALSGSSEEQTVITIPTKLLPAVRQLLAAHSAE